MSAVVVYESMFGNTEEVARAVAAGLGEHLSTRVVRVGDELAPLDEGVDIVVLGGPTHAFSMSRPGSREDAVRKGAAPAVAREGVREFLGGSRPQAWRGPVATFDTRVAKVRHMPGSAARKAAAILRRQGHRLVAEPESFYVADIRGPLLAGEIQRARTWGAQLGASVRETARTDGGVT
jgi:flavodoxin